MSDRVVVIGGNAAGMTAASRAKRIDSSLDVTIFESGDQIAYSICGLPFWLSGRVPAYEDLILYTPERLMNERGIRAFTSSRVSEIHPHRRTVVVANGATDEIEERAYDRLLIATGYQPTRPAIEGIDGDGVFTASHISDGTRIDDYLDRLTAARRLQGPARALLLGGGYIGLEMVESLLRRGLEVTLVEAGTQLLPGLDPDMAEIVQQVVTAHGVTLHLGRRVARIERDSDGRPETAVVSAGGLRIPADLLFVDVGVEPRVNLARRCGIKLGSTGAIEVDDWLQTSQSGIYAAGNCAETTHLVSGRPMRSTLGTVAAKQGRVAGDNLAGRRTRFAGAIGTSTLQVFETSVARTGLSFAQAREVGLDAVESRIEARFQAGYFDDGAAAVVKVIAERGSERLLGFQIVGSREGALRIDAAAAAVQARMSVDEASQLDLAYAPPLGSLWNPLLVALNTLKRELD